MKCIAATILMLAVSICVYPQKKKLKEPVTAIQFEMFGRRGRTEIKITADSAISSSRTGHKFILVTAVQWNGLLGTVKNINLPGLHKLISPTSRRDMDGALHCRIFICTKNKKYETQYFDSGVPMKQIRSLYESIETLRNAIDEDGKDLQE